MSTRIDLLELSKEELEKIAMNCVEVILEEITKNKQAFVGLVGRAISLSNSQVGPGDFLTFSFPVPSREGRPADAGGHG